MNKRIMFLLPMLMLSSCGTPMAKVEVDYDPIGGFVNVSKSTYMNLFNESKNILTLFTLKDISYCSDCLNISFSDVAQYAIDNHFNIYFYEFNTDDKNFLSDYVELVEMMKANNDNGLKELTYQNDLPVFDGLPCLMYSSQGYIGYNVTSNFVQQLKDTVVVKKNS